MFKGNLSVENNPDPKKPLILTLTILDQRALGDETISKAEAIWADFVKVAKQVAKAHNATIRTKRK